MAAKSLEKAGSRLFNSTAWLYLKVFVFVFESKLQEISFRIQAASIAYFTSL
jgi:hypothetical protein